MDIRAGETGQVLGSATPTLPGVAAILAGGTLDVAFTDAKLIGAQAIVAMPVGAPAANLTILGAWVTNALTGACAVRLGAGTGGFAGGNVPLQVQQLG